MTGKNDLVMQSCSHNRGKFYFVESLNDGPGFVGTKCGTWEEFVSGSCDGNPQVRFDNRPLGAPKLPYRHT